LEFGEGVKLSRGLQDLELHRKVGGRGGLIKAYFMKKGRFHSSLAITKYPVSGIRYLKKMYQTPKNLAFSQSLKHLLCFEYIVFHSKLTSKSRHKPLLVNKTKKLVFICSNLESSHAPR
jgi:hypothetical protein